MERVLPHEHCPARAAPSATRTTAWGSRRGCSGTRMERTTWTCGTVRATYRAF